MNSDDQQKILIENLKIEYSEERYYIIFEILLGDFEFIRKNFFYMVKQNRFPYLCNKNYLETEMWANDLCSIVSEELWKRCIKMSLHEIDYPKAFIRRIILYKSLDENSRDKKYLSIDSN